MRKIVENGNGMLGWDGIGWKREEIIWMIEVWLVFRVLRMDGME